MAGMRPAWKKSEFLLFIVPLCFAVTAYFCYKAPHISVPNRLDEAQGSWGRRCRSFTLAFSPDGGTLASGDDSGYIYFWNVATGLPIARLRIPSGTSNSIDFSADGKLVAAVTGFDDNRQLCIWDRETLTIRDVLTDGLQRTAAVAFSPDSQRLATGNYGQCTLLNIAAAPRLPDSSGGSLKPSAKMRSTWPASSGQPPRILRANPFAHRKSATPVGPPVSPETCFSRESCEIAFSPDGTLLASIAGPTDAIELWDGRSGQMLKRLAAPPGRHLSLDALAFTPDGKSIAAQNVNPEPGGSRYAVRFWDVKTGKQTTEQYLNDGIVHCFAFSPSGRLLATGDNEGDIVIWDRTSGKPVQTLKMRSFVYSVVFSPNSRMLASSSFNGEVRVMPIAQP